MRLLLQRYSDNGRSTQGLLFERDMLITRPLWFCHTIEDRHREVKVAGKTRIPAGIYPLKIRREDTPLTIKHRGYYGKWFKYHIEIVGIPGFVDVYIHAGNDEDDTAGCLLLNDTANNHIIEHGAMARSLQAVERFYKKIYPLLEAGTSVELEIRDEVYLMASVSSS